MLVVVKLRIKFLLLLKSYYNAHFKDKGSRLIFFV